MTHTVIFQVIGEQQIHCAGCEHAIQRALTRVEGIRKVKANHQTQHVVVHLESARTSAQSIRGRLETMGYHVEALT
jgi:copper chaperone CopZ